MATIIERTQAILDALKNDAVDPALAFRVVDAFVASYPALWPVDGEGEPYEPVTNAEKATVYILAQRRYNIDIVKAHEAGEAAEAARLAALAAVEAEVDLG